MRGPLLFCSAVAALVLSSAAVGAPAAEAPISPARVLATGIAGAGAVSAVGVFHAGGPIHDLPAFAAFTMPGRVLDPSRILVTSSSNFGNAALPGMPQGSVLSVDATSERVRVPAAFASAGGQATAADGRVQLFTAASPGFTNGVNTPKSVTAAFPAVANPLGISINNAFGRLWFPSAPNGFAAGFESIIDPTGLPLANAPDQISGGVFADTRTNRSPTQLTPGGMTTAMVANALLGMSPDGSKRAVFAVLAADGSIAQAHTERGVDGLAPRGTVTPQRRTVTRAGMLFNWVPDRALFITDAPRNAIVVVPLGDDTHVFTAATPHRLTNAALHRPIDLAPAVPESANGVFSSNTTLAGNSDIYVLNDDGSIVRMHQDGSVFAIRRVSVDGSVLGAGRIAGIATSPDAGHIWLTVRGALPGEPDGALVEIPAFSGALATGQSAPQTVASGEAAFRRAFTPAMGLGPLYNERSCIACHLTPSAGGMGMNGLSVVTRIARLDGTFDALDGRGGPIARAHSVSELGVRCSLAAGIPAVANITSLRNTLPLFDDGAIDFISDRAILAGAIAYPDGVHGRPNTIVEQNGAFSVGRFGWKADVARLETFVAQAFRNEMGVTNPLFPHDLIATRTGSEPCAGERAQPDDDGKLVRAVSAYVASLSLPATDAGAASTAGAQRFVAIGCDECHATALRASNEPLYSDLLLHDMGPALDDGFVQGAARGTDWRTTPLHGIRLRQRFLHDGRATSLRDAILAHDGEAASSIRRYRELPLNEQRAVVAFVSHL